MDFSVGEMGIYLCLMYSPRDKDSDEQPTLIKSRRECKSRKVLFAWFDPSQQLWSYGEPHLFPGFD